LAFHSPMLNIHLVNSGSRHTPHNSQQSTTTLKIIIKNSN
jgi:hypothetical protein